MHGTGAHGSGKPKESEGVVANGLVRGAVEGEQDGLMDVSSSSELHIRNQFTSPGVRRMYTYCWLHDELHL